MQTYKLAKCYELPIARIYFLCVTYMTDEYIGNAGCLICLAVVHHDARIDVSTQIGCEQYTSILCTVRVLERFCPNQLNCIYTCRSVVIIWFCARAPNLNLMLART